MRDTLSQTHTYYVLGRKFHDEESLSRLVEFELVRLTSSKSDRAV